MTEKRYFKKMWEEEYYIFDSNTISESDFEEKLEYQDYKAFEDSMMGDEVVNRLNELAEENQRLKAQLTADIDGVCSLCNHHYLVKDKVMQGFYTGKCEKGHEKASKEAVKYCEDFDLKVKE